MPQFWHSHLPDFKMLPYKTNMVLKAEKTVFCTMEEGSQHPRDLGTTALEGGAESHLQRILNFFLCSHKFVISSEFLSTGWGPENRLQIFQAKNNP